MHDGRIWGRGGGQSTMAQPALGSRRVVARSKASRTAFQTPSSSVGGHLGSMKPLPEGRESV